MEVEPLANENLNQERVTLLVVTGTAFLVPFIGSAINLSGLGDRMAATIAPALTGSYLRLIGGLTLVAMLLGFLMPSSVGRAVALVPIGMALAERVGFGPGSNGRIGIAVSDDLMLTAQGVCTLERVGIR